MIKFFDPGIIIAIVITILLVVVAIFARGFTLELLPEAGVLLISIRMIMVSYVNSPDYIDTRKELNESTELMKDKYY